MSAKQGMGTGALILHVLVSVVAAFMAGRMLDSTLAAMAVGAVSIALFKWRQHRTSGGLTTDQMVAERLQEVEDREADVEAVHARLAELEERLDFSERMLARQNERQVGKPSDG